MLSGPTQLFDGDERSTSTIQAHRLGSLGITFDGRKYRYAKAGGTDLSPGKLAVAATVVANHVDMAVQAAADVGDTSVSVTLGNTLATSDQYAEGTLTINNEAGEGISYLVSGNPAADSTATLALSIEKSGVTVALTTSSKASLALNRHKDVVISATDQGDLPVGIPNVTIEDTEFGWLQTGGECAAFADETLAIGTSLTTGTGVAGSLEVVDAAGEHVVGIASQAGVDDEYRGVFLTLD